MPKIIVVSQPADSHVTAMLAVARDLAARGHEVVVYTGARFEQRARAVGAGFRALPPDADYDDRNINRQFPERGTLPLGPARVAFDIKTLGIKPVPAQLRCLWEFLGYFPADVIIGEHVNYLPLALSLAAPYGSRPLLITLGIFGPLFHSEDAAPAGRGILPLPGEPGRALNRELNAQAVQAFGEIQAYAEEVFASIGLKLDEFVFDAVLHHSDHYLQLTVPGFEYPRGDVPSHFRFVGPVPPNPPAADFEPPAWWSELSGERRVVVVTQGTLANDDLAELVVPTLRALADLDVLVVAATARDDGPDDVRRRLGTVPDNVRLAGFVPFEHLLPLADVLVTNGGYGGVHVALRHGVPMVVAGDSEDKPEVAARVEWSGTGVNLRTARPRESAVRAAVQAVLNDASFRLRAQTLSQEIERHRPFDEIAAIVEHERHDR